MEWCERSHAFVFCWGERGTGGADPAEERALMDRALAENAVIVAQMEPLFGDEDEEGDED